jgi:hypothetical protein
MAKYPSDFRQWHTELVENTFGLTKVALKTEWNTWQAAMPSLDEATIKSVTTLFEKNAEYLEFWSEANIKLRFIYPLLDIADMNTKQFSIFAEHKLTTTLTNTQNEAIKLIGIPDLILAKGTVNPKNPFFCLHEYKPQKGNTADARGQLLAAMLVANQRNTKENNNISPLYGSYTLGKEWLFVLLKEKEYMVSKTYLMNELEDLIEVVRLLRALKGLFGAYLNG